MSIKKIFGHVAQTIATHATHLADRCIGTEFNIPAAYDEFGEQKLYHISGSLKKGWNIDYGHWYKPAQVSPQMQVYLDVIREEILSIANISKNQTIQIQGDMLIFEQQLTAADGSSRFKTDEMLTFASDVLRYSLDQNKLVRTTQMEVLDARRTIARLQSIHTRSHAHV